MKISLFLSVVSVFTIFHLCKAGPLRHLQKRAAFYIANETACVVDNIVYTSGDPIPTDDPCEACRCRPPGFACVLKECKIKPGCRAVRRVGECCPEYICGCEHNGRFYKDGDEIKDPKNPCYQCYCQGSSIACAFVDCIYRDECESVFMPGECCPQYINCTRDIPDRNLFIGGGSVFPPINVLPVFNEESVLPEISSTDQAIEQPENPTSPVQPEEPNDTSEKVVTSENIEPEDTSSKSETVEPESLVTEEKILNTEVKEKDPEPLKTTEETKQDPNKENGDKEAIETGEETETLLNSESDINKNVDENNSETQTLELTTEPEKELPQTTVESKSEESVKESEVTEKPLESQSTEITEKEPQIKNSAAENSKSLKLTDTDESEKLKEDQQSVKSDTKTVEEAITEQEQASESTNITPTDGIKESSITENRLPSEENVEKSQENSDATPFYTNNPKIKSESAETVTIVVHVKESSKIPTETDYIAETVTPVPVANVSEENLLKSNDEIEVKKEASETEDNKSTNKNFEIFATTKQASEVELTSISPSTDKNADVQGRSDEADNIAMEAEENPVTEPDPKTSDSNNDDESSITTSTVGATEDNKEVKTNEEVNEEKKGDEPTSTVIEIDTSRPIIVKLISTSPAEKETKNDEPEKTEEAAPEVRSDAAEQEEKTGEETTVQSNEEPLNEEKSTQAGNTEPTTEKGISIPEEKVQDSTQVNIDENPEIRTNEKTETEKTEDKTNTENVEEKQTEENKPEITTESKSQSTEEPKQTTLSDN